MEGTQSVSLRSLASKLSGYIATPKSGDYTKARVIWNGMIETKPLAFVMCKNPSDVMETIQFAQDHNLKVSVKGGGHDFAGRALCDGLVIDTSLMKSVKVNEEKKTVTLGSGVDGGELLKKIQKVGFYTTTGNMSSVGITGLELGGGYGPLMCNYGLVCDNVLSFTMITASGEKIIADEKEYPDLFFALRGGGGNFGVVTDMTMKMYPQKQLLAGLIVFPITNAKKIFAAYNEVITDAPNTLTTTVGFTSFNNAPVIYMNFVYCGAAKKGEQLLKTFLSFDTPLMSTVKPIALYDLITHSSEGAPFGRNYYLRTANIKKLTKPSLEVFLDMANSFASPLGIIPLLHARGAVLDPKGPANAFTNRKEHFMVEIIACWDGKDELDAKKNMKWTDDSLKALLPYAMPGGYISLLKENETARVSEAFGSKSKKLQSVKKTYDPHDVFRSFGRLSKTT